MKRRRRRRSRAGGETRARRTRARRTRSPPKVSLTYIIVDSYEQKKMTIY